MNDPIADLITAWIVALVICALWNTRKTSEPDDYPDDGGFAASQRAGYVEDVDAWADRINQRTDTAYRRIQQERQRLNQQGDS